jgi:hypothetical protein
VGILEVSGLRGKVYHPFIQCSLTMPDGHTHTHTHTHTCAFLSNRIMIPSLAAGKQTQRDQGSHPRSRAQVLPSCASRRSPVLLQRGCVSSKQEVPSIQGIRSRIPSVVRCGGTPLIPALGRLKQKDKEFKAAGRCGSCL